MEKIYEKIKSRLLRFSTPNENSKGQETRGDNLLRFSPPNENSKGQATRGDNCRLLDIIRNHAAWRTVRLLYRREFAHLRFMEWFSRTHMGIEPSRGQGQSDDIKTARPRIQKLILWILLISGILLLMAGIEPNPGPRPRKPRRSRKAISLKVMTWNAASLSAPEIRENTARRLKEESTDVLFVQETRISPPTDDPQARERGFFTIQAEHGYTMYCSLPDEEGTATKYGCGIMLTDALVSKIAAVHSDSPRRIEVILNYGQGETIKLAAVYAVQDNCRPESRRRDFWTTTSRMLKERYGARRMATIVGIDANGRMASADGRNVGPHLLHDQETKNGSSLRKLLQECDLRAQNTLRHDDEGGSYETFVSNRSSGRQKSQIDFVLSSADFKVKELRIVRNWVDAARTDRHLPIVTTLSIGHRAGAAEGTAGQNRPTNPMRLKYCASELRATKKAAAAGSTEALAQMDMLRKNVAFLRDAWDGNDWDELWRDVEQAIAAQFPRRQMPRLAQQSVTSTRTAQLKDQIQHLTDDLLSCSKYAARLTMEECFKQWRERRQITANAESRVINGKKQIKCTFLQATNNTAAYGWAYDNDLKLIPNGEQTLIGNRVALLKYGQECKTRRAALRRELKRAQHKDHQEHVEQLAASIEQQPSLDERIHKTWDMVKNLRDKPADNNKRGAAPLIKAPDGTSQSTPEGKAKAFADYVAANFSLAEEADHLSDEEWEQMQEKPVNQLPETATASSISRETRALLEQEVTLEEITRAFKELKPNKAIGLDHICSEVFLIDPEGWGRWLQPRFRNLNPETQTGRVIWLYKNKGSASDPSNYRPISILSPVYKVWTKAMTWKCDRIIRDIASTWQFGFRKERGTREALYAAQTLLSEVKSGDLSLALLDLSKAFDRCNRKLLYSKLLELGAPKDFVSQLRHGHQHTKLRACFDGAVADPVEVQKGVYQGSPLSPALYIIYAHCMSCDYADACEQAGIHGIEISNEEAELPTALRPSANQVPRMGDKKVRMLCYADDTTIVARDMEELTRALAIYEEVANRYNMKVNSSKTKILTRRRLKPAEKISWASEHLGVTDPEKAIEIFVENATFLGSLINIRGYSHQACVARANEGRRIFKALEHSFFRNGEVPRDTKMRVYSAVFPAVILYGIDAYACSEHDITELQTLQNLFLRAIYEGKWKQFENADDKINFLQNRTSNLSIQKELKVASVKSLIARARLRFIESLHMEGRRMNGAIILHKYKLAQGEQEEDDAAAEEPAQKRRRLPEYMSTIRKRMDTLFTHVNQRFTAIKHFVFQRKSELDGEFRTLEARWPAELTKSQIAKRKAARKQEWNEQIKKSLMEEHDCTYKCAGNFETLISGPLDNVETVDFNTPRILGTSKWKALSNWVLSTRAGVAAQESTQAKQECLGCRQQFLDVSKHLSRIERKRQADAAPHTDCLQHYSDNLCPIVPAENEQQDDGDVIMEGQLNWRDHPERFKCPLNMKACTFPNKSTYWCIVCKDREQFTPNQNKAQVNFGRKRNRMAQEVKKVTGREYIPHSGKVELSCPKKLKTCRYPDISGWWCKPCVERTGHMPEANKEKQELARLRKEQRQLAQLQQQQQQNAWQMPNVGQMPPAGQP